MAMLPFCGYNMGKYYSHWLSFESRAQVLPKIFIVNWFRKDENGKFVWPGYGENSRVLKWMFERIDNKAGGTKTFLGLVPRYHDIDWSGINFTPEQFNKAIVLDPKKWQTEFASHKEFFAKFNDTLPIQFLGVHENLNQI
jgi:phosphoenolpyruvate carboxykinase (GTP)